MSACTYVRRQYIPGRTVDNSLGKHHYTACFQLSGGSSKHCLIGDTLAIKEQIISSNMIFICIGMVSMQT